MTKTELQARLARAVSQSLLEAGGDLSRASSLLSLLEAGVSDLLEVWLIPDQGEAIPLRAAPGQPSPSPGQPPLPTGTDADDTRSYHRFPVPGQPTQLVLRRPAPFTPLELEAISEVCYSLATVLELRATLLKRARLLEDDFDLLVEATREISRCQSLEDLYEVIAREGQILLKQKKHTLFCLQRYSAFNEEVTCVAISGENTDRFRGLKLTTDLARLKTTYYPRTDDGKIAQNLPRQQTLSFTGALLKSQAAFLLIPDVDQLEEDEPYYCLSSRTRSEIALPIVLRDGTRWGVLNVENPHPNAFSEFFDLPLLQGFTRIIAVFIQELERRDKTYTLDDLISLPEDLKKVIRLFAQADEAVLITGETGTGKEVVARALHYGGLRKKFKFIPVNCGAIEPNLMMSELFGYTAHAFTGAGGRDREGLFQAADKGTIFLDEIENMSMPVQEALLRVVERGEIRKVGETAVQTVDVRLIAATNVDLSTRIKDGSFRQDLYYRLKILEITLPPLRERKEFIPALLETFVGQLRRPMQDVRIDPRLVEALLRYDWPGNIRELQNLVKRLLVFSQDLTVDLLPEEMRLEPGSSPSGVGYAPPGGSASAPDASPPASTPGIDLSLRFDEDAVGVLEQLERRALQEALTLFGGDRYKVARFLGISPPSVYRKIKQYDIQEVRQYR